MKVVREVSSDATCILSPSGKGRRATAPDSWHAGGSRPQGHRHSARETRRARRALFLMRTLSVSSVFNPLTQHLSHVNELYFLAYNQFHFLEN